MGVRSEAPQAGAAPGRAQDRVTSRCRGWGLSTNVVVIHTGTTTEGTTMTLHYSSPALEAEIAYRREVLTASGHGTRTRPNPWFRSRRRAR